LVNDALVEGVIAQKNFKEVAERKEFGESSYNSPLKALSKMDGSKALSSASVSDCSFLSLSTLARRS